MTFEEAKAELSNYVRAGGLSNLSPWISWSSAETEITLDGDFDIDLLEAIVTYIRRVNAENT